MGVTLLHDSFKLAYTEGLVSQVFRTHSLTAGAAKPASDLKSGMHKPALDGPASSVPLPPAPTLKC